MMKVSSPVRTRTSPVPPERMPIFCEKVAVLDLPLCITPDRVKKENAGMSAEPMLKNKANLS